MQVQDLQSGEGPETGLMISPKGKESKIRGKLMWWMKVMPPKKITKTYQNHKKNMMQIEWP